MQIDSEGVWRELATTRPPRPSELILSTDFFFLVRSNPNITSRYMSSKLPAEWCRFGDALLGKVCYLMVTNDASDHQSKNYFLDRAALNGMEDALKTLDKTNAEVLCLCDKNAKALRLCDEGKLTAKLVKLINANLSSIFVSILHSF